MTRVTDTMNPAKQAQREEITSDVEAFLARGGVITKIENGVVSEFQSITVREANKRAHAKKGRG